MLYINHIKIKKTHILNCFLISYLDDLKDFLKNDRCWCTKFLRFKNKYVKQKSNFSCVK